MFSSLSSQQRWCYICLCFQALYVVIWYCCLRNQLRGVFKESFAIPSVPPPIELRDDMFRDSPSPGHSISSLKRSGMRNSPDDPVRYNMVTVLKWDIFKVQSGFLQWVSLLWSAVYYRAKKSKEEKTHFLSSHLNSFPRFLFRATLYYRNDWNKLELRYICKEVDKHGHCSNSQYITKTR